jgi:hypothetical protein
VRILGEQKSTRRVPGLAIIHILEKMMFIEVHCSAVSVFFESTGGYFNSELFTGYVSVIASCVCILQNAMTGTVSRHRSHCYVALNLLHVNIS